MNEHSEPLMSIADEPVHSATTLSALSSGAGERGTGSNPYRTEVEGWQAAWIFDHALIRIMLVHNESDATELIRADNPATAPDLAALRERFPRLSPLWDAVRRQFWTESLGPGIHPQPSHHV